KSLPRLPINEVNQDGPASDSTASALLSSILRQETLSLPVEISQNSPNPPSGQPYRQQSWSSRHTRPKANGRPRETCASVAPRVADSAVLRTAATRANVP